MKQVVNLFGIWMLAMMLMSCAGVVPKTVPERMAVVDAQVTAVINTAADLREGGLINDELYADLDEYFEAADHALDLGWRSVAVGDMDRAEAQIRVLNELLWAIREKLPKETNNGN